MRRAGPVKRVGPDTRDIGCDYMGKFNLVVDLSLLRSRLREYEASPFQLGT